MRHFWILIHTSVLVIYFVITFVKIFVNEQNVIKRAWDSMVKKVVLSEEGTFEPSTESQEVSATWNFRRGDEDQYIWPESALILIRRPSAFALESVKWSVFLTSDWVNGKFDFLCHLLRLPSSFSLHLVQGTLGVFSWGLGMVLWALQLFFWEEGPSFCGSETPSRIKN